MQFNILKQIVSAAGKSYIYYLAAILLGLIFVTSGSGKLIGFEETSSQIIDFIFFLVPDVFIVPATMYFMLHILVPYIFPLAEFFIGIFLLIGFVPRLSALVSIAFSALFMISNIWAIAVGQYTTCASCFGFWEDIFGHLTPVQSLIIDVAMIVLAVLVIVFHSGTMLSSEKRLSSVIRNQITPLFISLKTGYEKSGLAHSINKTARQLSQALIVPLRKRVTVTVGFITALICLILLLPVLALAFTGTLSGEGRRLSGSISEMHVGEITENSATISLVTALPAFVYAYVYEAGNTLIHEWKAEAKKTAHTIQIGGLESSTRYLVMLQFAQAEGGIKRDVWAMELSFITAASPDAQSPPVVSEVDISVVTDTSVAIVWKTDEPARATLYYRESDSIEKSSVELEGYNVDHYAVIDNLLPENVYTFSIEVSDHYGNTVVYDKERAFSTATGAVKGRKAPDFSLETLGGETVTLEQYRGKTAVLTFWMVTCNACRHEVPLLERAAQELPQDKIVFLNVHAGLNENIIKGFLGSEGLDLEVLLDLDKEVSRLYSVTGVPTTFIIDGNGFIQAKDPQIGTFEQLMSVVNEYID